MSRKTDENGITTRSFEIATSSKPPAHITVHITEPNLTAENLPLETWASSWVMATQLHKLSINIPSSSSSPSPSSSATSPIPILELGAGTGLVGITASHLWSHPVLLTDLSPIVPGLQSNISLNPHILSSTPPSSCGTLDWNHPSFLHLSSSSSSSSSSTPIPSSRKAHVILAADTVYSEEHPELLTRVVSEWLARTGEARFVITYAMRVAYLEEIRGVWERLEGAGLVAVGEGQERAGEGMFDDEGLCEWSVWKWKDL